MTAFFADILYPKEVGFVMKAVLAGNWFGPDPEQVIDALIKDFVTTKIKNKQEYLDKVVAAVKSVGCLDCVYARLNLSCFLDAIEGDKITIRYNRVRKLPGENHGVGCVCSACRVKAAVSGSDRLLDRTDADVEARRLAGVRRRALGKLSVEEKEALGLATEEPDQSEKHQPAQEVTDAPVEYPTDQETLDDLERTFYANEDVLKQERQLPVLSAERKAEILEAMRAAGYRLAGSREEAFVRLEQLLRTRSFEQQIIGRLAFTVIFEGLRGLDGNELLVGIQPHGFLR